MTTENQAPEGGERAAFEVWMKGLEGYPYAGKLADRMWQGWQARAALAAQPAPKLDDSEQYRMQMAGISTAALGYWTEADTIHPDYDTVPLRDVAKLYVKYDALYKARVEAQANPPQPAEPSPAEGEREEFERWAEQRDLPLDETLGSSPAEASGPNYVYVETVEAWEAWQARAGLAAANPQPKGTAAAVPMCSEQAVLHALTMARSETHKQGDAALWQAFGRAMWRQFNAMLPSPAPGADTSKIAAYLRWIMRTVNNFEAKTGKGGWFAEEMQDACNAIAKETGTPVKFGISSHSTDYEHPTGDNPFPSPAVGAVPQGPRTEFVLNELRSALNAMLTFFGMDEDENSKEVFNKARQAYDYAQIVMRPLEPWERQSLEDFRACVHRWHEKAAAKGYDGVEAMCDLALSAPQAEHYRGVALMVVENYDEGLGDEQSVVGAARAALRGSDSKPPVQGSNS